MSYLTLIQTANRKGISPEALRAGIAKAARFQGNAAKRSVHDLFVAADLAGVDNEAILAAASALQMRKLSKSSGDDEEEVVHTKKSKLGKHKDDKPKAKPVVAKPAKKGAAPDHDDEDDDDDEDEDEDLEDLEGRRRRRRRRRRRFG